MSFVVILTLCFKLSYGIVLNFLLYLSILSVDNMPVHVCRHALSIALHAWCIRVVVKKQLAGIGSSPFSMRASRNQT